MCAAPGQVAVTGGDGGPMPGERIMIFTIPNEGHFNILKRLIRHYGDRHSFAVTLVDRHNSAPEVAGLPARVHTLDASSRYVNTPAARVFARAADLLDECLRVSGEFQPDLILYDLCAIEGRLTADVLGVPSWCSIAGLIGPLMDTKYLAASVYSAENQQALRSIRRRHGRTIDPDQVELVSNSLYLPAELNLLWSYPAVTPDDFRRNRRPARYQFAGYLSDGHPRRPRSDGGPPLVYLSFGTEVMDNLWLSQEETRQGLRACVSSLTTRWEYEDLRVVFVTMGRRVLDTYPPNWTVVDRVDQQRVLSEADVFVTHGGSNSFHEALLARVPMVVVPFFGDQVLTGRRVDELGIGIGLGVDDGIDKDKPKDFLVPELAGRVDEAVRLILHEPRYRTALERVPLEATPPLAQLGRLSHTSTMDT